MFSTANEAVLKQCYINECKYSSRIESSKGKKYKVGGIRNKENVAIFSGEHNSDIDINKLLQVPDDKKLTVWSDKD